MKPAVALAAGSGRSGSTWRGQSDPLPRAGCSWADGRRHLPIDAGIRRRRRSEIAVAPVDIDEAGAPSEAPNEVAAESGFAVDHEAETPTERSSPSEASPYEMTPAVVERSPAPPSAPTPPEEPEHRAPSLPSRYTEETRAPAAHAPPSRPSSGMPDRPRPRPITPGAPRPRPVASSGSFMPPRPIASAAPGGTTTRAIKELNDFIATDGRVECVMVPIRDGVSLIRRR